MKKIDLNDSWSYRHLESGEPFVDISLPHDAMISEDRRADNQSGVNACWFGGYDYEYVKRFTLPKEFKGKVLTLEFEGVYRNAEVYLNGKLLAYRPYGYTNFYVPITDRVRFGEQNELRVIARNADQPNSRWYSGAGIYRPVNLWVADRRHVAMNGVRVRTLSIRPAVVEVSVRTSEPGELKISIEKNGRHVASAKTLAAGDKPEARATIKINEAELWSPDTPVLYECIVTFDTDRSVVPFGIRTIAVSAKEGFTLNGKRVVIRGACIHHDNGILGARCIAEAERRKVEILKKWGYNAIRSAHNPCSKALLEACDRLGVMVMDEYCDMWYIHKTRFDYADYVSEWYERDITDMIEKDYNHPSVIMYSLGNEVAETGQKRGVEFMKRMQDVCHLLDGDRPVTTGVNIFFNLLYSMGLGFYSDKKAMEQPKKKVGSEFFNDLTGRFGAEFMKRMAKLHGCDVKTRDCYAAMDVAGYNYGILRYARDAKKYPDRVILGSETFCSDAYAFWELAKKTPAVIGDFVWAGMDYLGEVGVGSWEYKDHAPEFYHGVGWMTAGSGRIDLIGNPLGEAYYTKVAFELEDKPQIAVVPVNHTNDKHSPSAWKFSNALPSWSWNGLDGKMAKVEVYSRAPIVELYVNGKKVGRKKFRKNCRFDFNVRYEGGEITAVNFDNSGKELSRSSLNTAEEQTIISVVPEKQTAAKGEVLFIPLKFTDRAGQLKPLETGLISVKVENGQLLALGNACPFNARGYCSDQTETYYGQALAVVRATGGKLKLTATCGDLVGEGLIEVV